MGCLIPSVSSRHFRTLPVDMPRESAYLEKWRGGRVRESSQEGARITAGASSSVSRIEAAGLGEVVLAWAADAGASYREIARRLESEYGLVISASTVLEWIKRVRADRAVGVHAVQNERLSETLTADLDIIDYLKRDLLDTYQYARSHSNELKIDTARALMDLFRTKAKFLGLDPAPTASATVAVIGGRRLPDMSDADLADLLLAARAPGVSLDAAGPEGVSLDAGAGLGAGAGAVPEMKEGAIPGLGAVAGPGASPEVLCRAAPGDGNRSHRE